MTGSSWVDIEAILATRSRTRPCAARRDAWIDAGVFEKLKEEALAAFDRIIGSTAPCGGEGTGPNPTDGAKLGWKWSVAAEGHGLHHDIGMLPLDRGYDYPKTRAELAR